MNWNKNNSLTKQPVEAAEVPEQAVIRVGHRNRYNQKDNFFLPFSLDQNLWGFCQCHFKGFVSWLYPFEESLHSIRLFQHANLFLVPAAATPVRM